MLFIFSVQGGYPAAYRVAQSASAATATYSDGYKHHTQAAHVSHSKIMYQLLLLK